MKPTGLARIRLRSPQERLEHFVGDCIHLMAKERENRAMEAKEHQLKKLITMEPEFQLTDADFAAVSEEDDAYASYEGEKHPQF